MTIMKARLKGAQKGHSLLKKKADALTMRFRQILKKIIEVGSYDIHNFTNYNFDTFLYILPYTLQQNYSFSTQS